MFEIVICTGGVTCSLCRPFSMTSTYTIELLKNPSSGSAIGIGYNSSGARSYCIVLENSTPVKEEFSAPGLALAFFM